MISTNDVNNNNAEYANYPKFDIIYIDCPASSSSLEELSFLYKPFVKKLVQLFDYENDESMMVINSGHAPSLENNNGSNFKMSQLLYEVIREAARDAKQDLDFDAIIPYDESLAQPLNSAFFLLFNTLGESYSYFFRQAINMYDIEIMKRFFTSNKFPYKQPTLLYDGPTHQTYQRPSRVWENWFCSVEPWKDFKICTEFLTGFFNPAHHHFNVEVRNDPVKGRTLYTMENITEGHFIIADYVTFNMDSLEWDILEDFISDFPSASMHQELRNFVNAYGVETDFLGKTGWSVVLTPQTFVNHGCLKEENNLWFPSVFANEGNDQATSLLVKFSPPIQRRPHVFSVLTIASRNITKGEELLIDYGAVPTYDDFEYDLKKTQFLSHLCASGEGRVTLTQDE